MRTCNPFTLITLALSILLLWQSQAQATDYCVKASPMVVPYTFRSVDKNTPLYQPVSEWFTYDYKEIYSKCNRLPSNWQVGLFIARLGGRVAYPNYEGHTIFQFQSMPVGIIFEYQTEKNPGVWLPVNVNPLQDNTIIFASSLDQTSPPLLIKQGSDSV